MQNQNRRKKMNKESIMIGIFIVICLCLLEQGLASLENQRNKVYSNNQRPTIYFCPQDNCSYHLASFIAEANNSVHCAFFDIKLREVLSSLADKSGNADVKLVIDNKNKRGLVEGNVLYDTSEQLSHNKFCVIDRKIVWTGSFNPTERGNTKNNNNAIVIYSAQLAENYEKEFSELWKGDFGKGEKTKIKVINISGMIVENYFCPEDNCAAKVIGEIRNARESVYFMTFSFTHEGVADALLFLNKSIEIKGIFEKSQGGSKYSQFRRLEGFGLDVIKDSNPYNMHHKVFIIDNKTVITGSFNPTKSGDLRNDENMLIIHDERIANRFIEEFVRLWY
ncbi:MAG: phospholipase D-like domain-containing protein [Nanoarchaeota archaeon]|nr:phospholipase D-like domain-containing protein [Nanoarchaeota archaeon]